MTTYAPPDVGANLSDIVTNLGETFDAVRSQERGGTVPPNAIRGQLWDCTDSVTLTAMGVSAWGEALAYYNSSDTWVALADVRYACLNAGGTAVPVANLPMGGYIHTGLGAGSANGHSVRYEQVPKLSTSNTFTNTLTFSGSGAIVNGTQVLDMNSQKITNLAAPSADGDAARKVDVDAAAGVVGTATISGGSSLDATVTLGFLPTVVECCIRRGTGDTESSVVVVFDAGSSGVDEPTRMLVFNNSGTTGVVVPTLNRSATGFTFKTNGAFFGSFADATLWYRARR